MVINHVIDPSYFYDAIEEFAFNYTIYVRTEKEIDEYGCSKFTFSTQTIRGSLQTQGSNLRQSKTGNTIEVRYNFYCKSLYRINIGDVIYYNNQYLMCEDTHDYDEWGVREASLRMISLTQDKDLAEYAKFIAGEQIV